MSISEHLFPSALSRTPSGLKKVLFVGSCVAEDAYHHLRHAHSDVSFQFELVNNALELSSKTANEAAEFDFQFVALSLRDVVTDQVVIEFPRATQADAESMWERAMTNLEAFLRAALRHTTEHGLLSFVATFSVPQVTVAAALDLYGSRQDFSALVRALNQRLSDIVRGVPNAFVADIDAIGNALGKAYFQDDSVSFSAHGAYWTARHIEFDTNPAYGAVKRLVDVPNLTEVYEFRDDQFLDALWRSLEHLFRTVRQIDSVKLVVFDLDDTLWRGQIAEHYGDGDDWPQTHGWPVGIWDAIYQLRGRGILTAICSKNDEDLVQARWGRASHWLRLDDFTFRKINWLPKAENIAAIMEQASLTAKSVVFVDDNPVECEAVRTAFPEIRILGANPYVTRRELLWSAETQIAHLSRESANRDQMMRAQQKREQVRATLSRTEFLAELGCKISVYEISDPSHPQFGRSLELINKTNQFNTTGERLSHQSAVSFMSDGGKFYCFEVEDKFTQYGLVGTIRIADACFKQFAMSCRVLGLDIETSMVSYVMALEISAGATARFEAQVRPTDANMVSRDVFARTGFKPFADGLYLTTKPPSPPAPHLMFNPAFPNSTRAPGWRFWQSR